MIKIVIIIVVNQVSIYELKQLITNQLQLKEVIKHNKRKKTPTH